DLHVHMGMVLRERIGPTVTCLRPFSQTHVGTNHNHCCGKQYCYAKLRTNYVLNLLALIKRTQHKHTSESGRKRYETEQIDELQHRAGNKIARYRGERRHAEEQHKHRRHQGTATHSSEADDDANPKSASKQGHIHSTQL